MLDARVNFGGATRSAMSNAGQSTNQSQPSATAACDVVACHDCDLLHRIPALRPGASASCSRCGALLRQLHANALDRALAFASASLVLYVLANVYVFMVFKVQGRVEVNHMISGVIRLYERGMPSLSLAILLTSIVIPGIKIALNLYILVPLRLGRTPRHLAAAYRWMKAFGPWGMLDVYMLGVLVAVVNLTAIASIELGIASYCFVALMLASSAVSAQMPHELIVSHMERRAT